MIRRNFFRCGMMGWCLELFWTGLHSLRIRDPKLTGRSSLWMFPIYGSAAFLAPLMRRLQKNCIWKRGLISHHPSVKKTQLLETGTRLYALYLCRGIYKRQFAEKTGFLPLGL